MSGRLDSDLRLWAEREIKDANGIGAYSSINSVERLLRDPGIASSTTQHKVLWWPHNRQHALISKAMHQIPAHERICMIVHYGSVKKNDESVLTDEEFAKKFKLGLRKFKGFVKKGKTKLRDILRSYAKRG